MPSDHARRSLAVSAAQPVTTVGDVRANVAEHVRAVRLAGGGLVVFPELSLTGYTTPAHPGRVVAPDDDRLRPLVAACAAVGATALVGAPVAAEGGGVGIGVLRVSGRGAAVVYRKVHLGGAEPQHFRAGSEPGAVPVHGAVVALGVCRDTGQAAHVDAVVAAAPDGYAAGLVHGPAEVDALDERARAIAARSGAWVVLANAAGPPTDDWPAGAGGRSGVWSADGTRRADAGSAPGAVVTWTVPLDGGRPR